MLIPRTRREWSWVCVRLALLSVCLASAIVYAVAMPGRSYKGPLPPLSDEERVMASQLREHVVMLAERIGERNVWRPEKLEEAAGYIESAFLKLGYTVAVQSYEAERGTVRNIEVERRGVSRPEEIVVVGAHYDSVQGSPGANDNATGVAGVLELARLLSEWRPARTVRYVAFVNEEPPFFQTDLMGSAVYARRSRDREENVTAMVSLEMLGCYSDEQGSQQYPFPFGFFYPHTADFIGVIGNLSSRGLVRRALRAFRKHAKFPSEGCAAPGGIVGIGWSDHWGFWQAGYRGIMVTDTAFFRYGHYHGIGDTPGKVDYERAARVVMGLAHVIKDLAENSEY